MKKSGPRRKHMVWHYPMILINVMLHHYLINLLISIMLLFITMLLASWLSREPQKIYLRYTLGCTLLTMCIISFQNIIHNSYLLVQPFYVTFAVLISFFIVSTVTMIVVLSVYVVMKIITGEAEKMLIRMIYTCISLIAHMLMHELGHVLFGVMSGYMLVSSQVLMVKLTKRNDGCIRFQIVRPVIGGVTYMVPRSNDNRSFIAYDLGGVAVNALITVPAAVFAFLQEGPRHLFFAVFCIVGFLFVVINTMPFGGGEWKNDGSDIYLLLHNDCARESYFAALQVERHVYLGKSLLSVNRDLIQPKEYGDVYSFSLAQMHAYILLLEGKYSEQRELIAKIKSSDDPFVKRKMLLLEAMITENHIISGTAIESIRDWAAHQDFMPLLKDNPMIAYRLLYWLSAQGFAPADSVPEYYLEQHEKQRNTCGSPVDVELNAHLMKLMKNTIKQEYSREGRMQYET